jgi:D-alanyl-D-alanine dipeptidase
VNKQNIYSLLESKMIKSADLIDVPTTPINEKLMPLVGDANLQARQLDDQVNSRVWKTIFVRQTVAKKLYEASKLLSTYSSELSLEVVYGYRPLDVQKKLYSRFAENLKGQSSSEELKEAVHRMIAVPTTAGHPTGGAVDVQILNSGQPINMGTKIWEFTKDSFTFSPFVDKEAWDNRQLLRHVMTQVGFAPFDGEWWHFSYGDKEWAKYYGKANAIYEITTLNNREHIPSLQQARQHAISIIKEIVVYGSRTRANVRLPRYASRANHPATGDD